MRLYKDGISAIPILWVHIRHPISGDVMLYLNPTYSEFVYNVAYTEALLYQVSLDGSL